MAEPTTSTATAWAVSAGLVASFLAALGVSQPAFVLASAGVFVGGGFAPKTGRVRAIVLFPCSAILAAKAGIVLAIWLPMSGLSSEHLGQAYAGLVGILFHPLVATLVRSVPARLGLSKWKGQSES